MPVQSLYKPFQMSPQTIRRHRDLKQQLVCGVGEKEFSMTRVRKDASEAFLPP